MNLKRTFKNAGVAYAILFATTAASLVSSCKKAESVVSEPAPAPLATTASTGTQPENTTATDAAQTTVPVTQVSAELATTATATVTNAGVSYRTSKPLTYTNAANITISGVSITAGAVPAITLNNCTNVRIQLSRFVNGIGVKAVGIYLYKCTNVTIENCYFSNVASGVYASTSTKVYIANNQMRNMLGPMPRGQFVQFDQCYGEGNKIMGNKFENVMGQSVPEDAINIYKSHGTASSPITVAYNWIRGGGPSNTGGGIALGDDGGSYQTAFENILVNPGQYGIAIASGTNMSIQKNKIFAARAPFTNVGTFAWNQYTSTSGCLLITIGGNEVNFTAAGGYQNSSWNGGNCGTINGWATNKWACPDVTAKILPTTMITMN